ncbi:type II toxin-antitoxin system CcdA family antitoxin [Thermogladius sp. KZ2Tp1]|uniref:type II toxin-antitoxin system CcdA family antitoxin n=1 Tax=Thermogladius sp. KZ2Tp1 TaxID=3136289 RepID=UPI003DA9A76D
MGDYVTVSTKVRRDVVERARRPGINVSELLRRVLEEEVEKRGSSCSGGGSRRTGTSWSRWT